MAFLTIDDIFKKSNYAHYDLAIREDIKLKVLENHRMGLWKGQDTLAIIQVVRNYSVKTLMDRVPGEKPSALYVLEETIKWMNILQYQGFLAEVEQVDIFWE